MIQTCVIKMGGRSGVFKYSEKQIVSGLCQANSYFFTKAAKTLRK